MKNVLLGVGLAAGLTFFSAAPSEAQHWSEVLQDPNANFFQIQDAFYKAWEGKAYVKGEGYKQFKRWEHFWETRINPDGSFPSYQEQWDAYDAYRQEYGVHRGSGGASAAGNWSPMGPFDYTNTDSWSPGLGRINVVVEDPNDSNIIYVGAPAGGVWKTTDGGSTWTPLGDDLPSIGVSWIAIDPTNTDILYMATGDNDGGDTYSIGIYKSTDAGLTWNPTGNIAGATNKVIIDPSNTNVLYSATTGGVFKSTDAGANWTELISGNHDDIEIHPTNSQIIYSVTNSEFYRTTDGGQNWSQITSGIPASSGRLKIAVSPDEPDWVYMVSAEVNNSFQGVYRSEDNGQTFQARNTTTDIFDGSTQAWYDLDIGVSDTDADLIMVGVLNVWRSQNGGYSWNQLNDWASPGQQAYTHADIHCINFFGGNAFVGSDGGVYKSQNNGSSFDDLSFGMQIGQFYTIAGTEQDVNIICGGLQDNGGFAYVNGTWRVYYGADGMESAIDPNNSQRIYGMIQYGSLYRSNNQGLTSGGQGSPEQGAWVTPMVFDPNNTRILAGYSELYQYTPGGGGNWSQISNENFGELRTVEVFPGNSDIIYVATTGQLHKTVDGGNNWTNITNFGTGSGITSVETHPTDEDIVWVTVGGVGALSGKVFVSLDQGLTWENITGNLPNVNVNILKHQTGSDEALYVGTDLGVFYRDSIIGSWIPFDHNLPHTIVNDLEIHHGSGTIRAGTYGRGVWESATYSAPTLTDDAGIQAIVSPAGTVCGVTFEPQVRLRNYGTNNLTSVTIIYDIDGGTPESFVWNGNLAPNATEIVTLPSATVVNGTHAFNVWTMDPNGTMDNYTLNDPASGSFQINTTGNVVHVLLSTDCFGSQTTFNIEEGGNVVVSEGPFTDVSGGESLSFEYCLDDNCYTVNVNDSGNDGLNSGGCGVVGDFVVTERLGDTLAQVASPAFGSTEALPICVANPLIAAFSTSKTTICSNTNITYVDQSAGSPSSWNWTFPGGTPATSTMQNPSVSYAAQGVYDAQLVVSNGAITDTFNFVNYMTVVSSPQVTIVATDETCYGNCDGTAAVNVSSGLPPYSIVWTGGLGEGNNFTNVCHGEYNVVVTDENGCVASGIVVAVDTGVQIIPSFTASQNPVLLSNGGTVTFTSGSVAPANSTYSWDFGDGNTSNAQNPTHTYSSTGVYDVSMTISDAAGICSETFDVQVTVLADDTGVEEDELLAGTTLYPNPGQEVLYIELPAGLKEEVQIAVFDMRGQRVEVLTWNVGGDTEVINVSEWAIGLYVIELQTSTGRAMKYWEKAE